MLVGANLLLLPAADIYIYIYVCVCVYPITDLRIPGRISGLMCALFVQPYILLSEILPSGILPRCSEPWKSTWPVTDIHHQASLARHNPTSSHVFQPFAYPNVNREVWFVLAPDSRLNTSWRTDVTAGVPRHSGDVWRLFPP